MSKDLDLLLAGAGHVHLGVLRLWRDAAKRPAGRIALVNDGPFAWYSGTLPGLLAGRYRAEQCRVPLQPLCEAAGITLIEGRLDGLNPATRSVTLADGRRLTASWLSFNLGSLPKTIPRTQASLEVLPVKPFAAFTEAWRRWQGEPEPLAIIGGGAAGVELALALAPRVPQLTLLGAGRLLDGHPAALRKRALRHLARAGARVIEQAAVDAMEGDALLSEGVVIWRGPRAILATGAAPLPWLREAGLAVDERGFVRIAATLQSLSHPQIFASGDCASLPGTPRNGVYAVRQGPVLAANLHAALLGEPFRPFVPQRHALALLADGQEGALMSWAGLTAEGRLLGAWKDRLDQGFIQRHTATSASLPHEH